LKEIYKEFIKPDIFCVSDAMPGAKKSLAYQIDQRITYYEKID